MGWYPCLEGNGAPFKVLNECYIGALWTVFSRLRGFINSGTRGRKPFIKKKERKREKKKNDYEILWQPMNSLILIMISLKGSLTLHVKLNKWIFNQRYGINKEFEAI